MERGLRWFGVRLMGLSLISGNGASTRFESQLRSTIKSPQVGTHHSVSGIRMSNLSDLTDSLIHAGFDLVVGYRFVTVCSYGGFIVLPHWETRPPAS